MRTLFVLVACSCSYLPAALTKSAFCSHVLRAHLGPSPNPALASPNESKMQANSRPSLRCDPSSPSAFVSGHSVPTARGASPSGNSVIPMM